MIYRVLYIPGGAGFLPSTVPSVFPSHVCLEQIGIYGSKVGGRGSLFFSPKFGALFLRYFLKAPSDLKMVFKCEFRNENLGEDFFLDEYSWP